MIYSVMRYFVFSQSSGYYTTKSDDLFPVTAFLLQLFDIYLFDICSADFMKYITEIPCW